MGQNSPHFTIVVGICGLPRIQAVDIAIEHAKGRGNQNGVVDLFVSSALLARTCDIVRCDVFAPFLDFAGNSSVVPRECEKP